ncbi:SHOCT domain-containing protein, partial [Streptomyces sp. NPDC001919]
MNTLAHTGPGPWVLLFPLVWAAAIVGIVAVARRAGLRRGRGPW